MKKTELYSTPLTLAELDIVLADINPSLGLPKPSKKQKQKEANKIVDWLLSPESSS